MSSIGSDAYFLMLIRKHAKNQIKRGKLHYSKKRPVGDGPFLIFSYLQSLRAVSYTFSQQRPNCLSRAPAGPE